MSPSPPIPILLTGVTGGLGAHILTSLLTTHNLPPSNIAVTARSASHRSAFEARGLTFRQADYTDPTTLEAAFANIHTLLFVSSSTGDTAVRNIEHGNVIAAAVQAGVKRVCYVSLAFGGWGSESKIGFQQAHYETEKQLIASGLDFLSLRAGIYTDAFPLFLNWYPSTTTVRLPSVASQGQIAWTSRSDLAEGIAALLAATAQGKELEASFPQLKPRTDRRILLLTGVKTASLGDLIPAIDRAQGHEEGTTKIEFVDDSSEWIAESARDDEGGKGTQWFEAAMGFFQGLKEGDAEEVDGALEVLLGGRRPETGPEAVERLLREAPGGKYYWHQNHRKGPLGR